MELLYHVWDGAFICDENLVCGLLLEKNFDDHPDHLEGPIGVQNPRFTHPTQVVVAEAVGDYSELRPLEASK
jgi:hypothetical protein